MNKNKTRSVQNDISLEVEASLPYNLESLLDNAPFGIYLIQDGKIINCNHTFAQILGFTKEEIVFKKTIKDLTFAGDWAKVEEETVEFLNSEIKTKAGKARLVRKDKKLIVANVHGTKTFYNEKLTIIGTLLDVTEELNNVEQLNILAQTLKSTSESVMIADLDHRIFFVNDTLCKLFGYKADELIGKYCGIFYEGILGESEFKKIIRASYNDGWHGEISSRRKDGSTFPSYFNSTIIRDKNNKPLALVGFIQDISTHKKVAEDLDRSEQKIKTLIDRMPDGLIYLKMITDENNNPKDFVIMQVNDSFKAILGIRNEEIIGKTVSENLNFVQDIGFDIIEKLGLICLKKTEEKFEVHSNKTHNHYAISSYCPEENHIVVIVKDVTKRRRIEQEIIKSRQMLRTILDNIPQRVFWKDLNSIFQGCNIHFARDLGFNSPDEVVGKSEYDINFENLAEEFISCDRYVMENDDPLNIDSEKHLKQDGTPYWIRLNKVPLKDRDNKVFGIVGTFEDISKQKKIEEDNRKLYLAVEQSPASIVITDLNGNIEYVNPKFSSVTGYSSEEAIGKNPKILKSGKMSTESYKQLWNTIKSGREWSGEFLNKKKNGELYWENALISPIKDSEGKTTHFIAIKEDITSKKNFEIELKAAKEKAEELNKIKSIFLANISHELRTPLIGILGYAETLYNEISSQEHKEMANILLKSGLRLKETLNLVLNLSNIEAEKVQIDLRNKNLTRILVDKMYSYHRASREKGLSFQLIIKEEKLHSKVDENMFVQIINNLFDNALKYTHEGEISIILDKVESDEKSFARITVRDTGIGIPEQSLKHIFEPFRQVSEGFSRSFEGIGLGLTITKRFVELLGGQISIDSEVSKGTEFSFMLPLEDEVLEIPEDEVAYKPSSDSGTINNNKPTSDVLLIEDDEPTAKVVEIYLKNLCNTEWAINGNTALEMSRRKKYSLVLVDINLGMGMDGLETVNKIKKIEGYENIPIIAVTAYAMYGDKEKFINAGCSHYISKPFNKNEIVNLIENLLIAQK